MSQDLLLLARPTGAYTTSTRPASFFEFAKRKGASNEKPILSRKTRKDGVPALSGKRLSAHFCSPGSGISKLALSPSTVCGTWPFQRSTSAR